MSVARGSGGGRIATLDGLRGISILLVLAGHACGTGLLPRTPYAAPVAEAGVRTFFVISGFLITTLLAREVRDRGRISLRDFYVRRSLRIFPAFYSYLALVVLLVVADAVRVSARDLTNAATYTMNFRVERPWLVGHLWSLSVEEQFYLLWPLVLVLAGVARSTRVAIAVAVVAPALRLVTWYELPGLRGLTDQALPFVFDSLGIGCALALGREQLEASPRYRRVLDARWFWVLPLVLVGATFVTRAWFELAIGTTLGNVGIALALHRCVSRPRAPIGRVLQLPPLVAIGTLSYSLYLWQQPFMNRNGTAWFNVFPMNVVCAFACATLCYVAIERPLLRLRNARAQRVATPVSVVDLSRRERPSRWMNEVAASPRRPSQITTAQSPIVVGQDEP